MWWCRGGEVKGARGDVFKCCELTDTFVDRHWTPKFRIAKRHQLTVRSVRCHFVNLSTRGDSLNF